jgi:hypothetical protein
MKHNPFRLILCLMNFLAIFALFGGISDSASPAIVTDVDRTHLASTIGISNDSPRRLISIGQTGGTVEDLTLQGNYAYVGVGPRLEVFNISQTDQPILLGKSNPLSGVIQDVRVDSRYAYVTTSGYGDPNLFTVLNIQNPEQITKLGSIPVTGCCRLSFVVQAGYVYLPGNDELLVIDVQDPLHPNLVNRVNVTTGTISDIAVVDTFLYLPTTVNELFVMDITHPATPTLLASAPANWGIRIVVRISIYQSYLYAIDTTNLYIYDIQNKSEPILVSSNAFFSHAQDIAAFNDYVSVIESAGVNRLTLVDVKAKSNPYSAGSLNLNIGANKVEAAGTEVYIANGGAGLRIIDVQNLLNPFEEGVYATVPKLWTLAVKDGFAYGGDQFGALSVLVTQGDAARQVGLYQPPVGTDEGIYTCPNGYWLFGDITLYDVNVSGDYVFAAAGVNGLQVFSVVNPSKPTLVGNLDTAGSAFGVAISGDKAYLADFCYGLRVIDIQDPIHPVEVGSYVGIEAAMGVAVVGHYVYVADRYAGLFVLDVQNPAAPVKVLELPGAGAWDVQVAGGYLYLPSAQNFQIYDLSNSAAPALLGELDEFGYYVVVDGDMAYLSAQSRIKAIDIHDPTHPTLIDWRGTPGLARGLAVEQEKILIADNDGGFYVMKLTDKVYFMPPTFH